MSKRHSATIRPLQLLDGPSSVSPSSPSTVMSSPVEKQQRRQSSISYVTSPTSTLSRHGSLNSASIPTVNKDVHRRSTGSLPALETDQKPPVTLVEKHADLLHFIAQKESKCLELRSQLAVHEAELLQLKRKWERIVSRGLEKERTDSPLSSASENPMLEGIREGVQGVSRLLAYGLSSTPTSPPSQYSASPLKKKKAYQSSISSMSSAARSTSGSSYDENDVSPDTEHEEEQIVRNEGDREILIVRDTGASPVVSPNPEFIQQEREREKQTRKAEYAVPLLEPMGDAKDTLRARRKNRDVRPLLSSSISEPFLSTSPDVSSTASSSPLPSPNVLSPLDYSEFSPTSMGIGDRKKANRSSLPPISSMPGMALATMVGTPSQTVSSWVGSVVGKKWEDTISKNQKRASTLLSDVSQSISQALTSPGSPSPFSSNSSIPPLSRRTKARSSPPPALVSTPEKSLPDEDLVRTPRVVNGPSSSSSSLSRTGKKIKPQDVEDEWNW